MPLPTPILDNRSWQELRDDLVRRIPVYNPEWTDHNASDPGITLIELFAFLGENLLFRFNQIPEATRLADTQTPTDALFQVDVDAGHCTRRVEEQRPLDAACSRLRAHG